jgi:hypothetical protein
MVTGPGASADGLRFREDQVGDGYGVLTDAARAAMTDVARAEGVLLDPVYTAKAFAGLRAAVRDGQSPASAPCSCTPAACPGSSVIPSPPTCPPAAHDQYRKPTPPRLTGTGGGRNQRKPESVRGQEPPSATRRSSGAIR